MWRNGRIDGPAHVSAIVPEPDVRTLIAPDSPSRWWACAVCLATQTPTERESITTGMISSDAPQVSSRRESRQRVPDAVLIFVLALLVRFVLVLLSRGGLKGNFGYDAAVYYTSADALVHGRMPYRDFVLLHPPALMLVLTPFAEFGRLTSDHLGFIIATAAFATLGAVSAALVVVVARALQMTRKASLLGGVFYAVWLGASATEISSRLEPLGSFLLLCGLWLLTAHGAPSRRRLILAGLVLGACVTVKIWWVVPLLVLFGWQLKNHPTSRRVWWFAGASIVSACAITAPFFLTAPGAMWHMVVTDQLGRHRGRGVPARLMELSSLQAAFPNLHGVGQIAVLVPVALLASALAVAAWRVVASRVLVVMAFLQLAVVLAAPTYFSYYSGYPAVAIALVVAAAASSAGESWTIRAGALATWVSVTAAVVVTGATVVLRPSSLVTPFPGSQLERQVTNVRCLMADAPMALIEMNALSRGLESGCANWVDVSGRTYGTDVAGGGRYLSRPRNVKWQRDIQRYLLSGDAFILIRPDTGLSAATRRTLTRRPVVARSGRFVVYRGKP